MNLVPAGSRWSATNRPLQKAAGVRIAPGVVKWTRLPTDLAASRPELGRGQFAVKPSWADWASCMPMLCALRVAWGDVAWRGVVWCGVLWCAVAWRGVAWYGVAKRGFVRLRVDLCGVVWCAEVWCGEVWC